MVIIKQNWLAIKKTILKNKHLNEEVKDTEHWIKHENNRNNNKIESFLLRRDVDKKGFQNKCLTMNVALTSLKCHGNK